jgi:hypothetical protein
MAPFGQWNKWFAIHSEKQFVPGAKVTAQWATSEHLDLFVTDADGRVWSSWWEDGPGWAPWFAIHSEMTFQPGASVTALWANADHLDLFVTNKDGEVWSTWWESGPEWQSWFAIHPETRFAARSTVTALWANSDHLDLFATDANGGVRSTWWEAAQGYQPWVTIHPETTLAPGATVTALWANSGHLDLFVAGFDGTVFGSWWESGPGYQPWFVIHPETTFAGGATVTALWANSGHLDLFITDKDGAVSSTWWESDPGWQPWFVIQPEAKFQPGATVTSVWANEDHLDLFITGEDGAVNSNWWHRDVGYSQWFQIHAGTKFEPGATVTALWANERHLDLFVTAADGVVWSCFYADTASADWALLANQGFERQSVKSTYFFAGNWRCCIGWQDWFPVRSDIKKFDAESTATAVWANESHLDLFSTDMNGVVWSSWSEIGGNGWQPWFTIHPETAFYPGAPVTAVWANSSHLDLFLTDANRLVWSTWWEDGPGWQPWFPIHHDHVFQRGGEVTALWASATHLDLFVSDSDGAVWSTWWEDGPGWQQWFPIFPSSDHVFKPGGKVAAAWVDSNHLDLFMTDLQGRVWSTWFEDGPGWQPWFMIHPEVGFERGAPVTALWANSSHLDLFVADKNGTVWSTWFENGPGWQAWFEIHSETPFNPGAPVTAQWTSTDHLDLFVTDKAGVAWSTWWESGPGWKPWFIIHPDPQFRAGARVTATLAPNGRVDLFVPSTDGTIWTSFYPGYPTKKFYELPMGPNEFTYTRHPSDPRDLGWSEKVENRIFAVDKMIEGGVNVVTMSYWGEPSSDRWAYWAPMHTSTRAHNELFDAAVGRNILIMPAIESGDATFGCGGHSPAYHFALDFPGSDNDPAPQLVAQIEDLITRYLKQPANPAWPGKWAQLYDRLGDKRYAINILHVGSTQLSSEQHAAFARGFDRVAARVLQQTGVLVGFTLDLLPREENPVHVNNGGCGQDDIKEITFTATPQDTGAWLRAQGSFLAVQAFIPEIYTDSGAKLAFKRDYLQNWIDQRLPVFLDVDPGYDAHLVFNNDTTWGNDDSWRIQLLQLRRELPVIGIVFNTWNGYTEGYAAVPTLENGDADFRWMQELFS